MTIKKIIILVLTCYYSTTSIAADQADKTNSEYAKYRFPAYIGVTYGYGATTWGYLIPPDENAAMSLSTPIKVSENGTLWGLYGGYEFTPSFALEASYMHYPKAKIYFDPWSLFTFKNNGLAGFTSHVQSLSVVGKFMLPIPRNTDFRAYSSVGAAGVHRDDIVNNQWKLSPKFGVGAIYLITEHIMTEVGIEYIAGDGVSELNPADSFIPFLYSGFVRLAMRL